jgi:hypothetical protein
VSGTESLPLYQASLASGAPPSKNERPCIVQGLFSNQVACQEILLPIKAAWASDAGAVVPTRPDEAAVGSGRNVVKVLTVVLCCRELSIKQVILFIGIITKWICRREEIGA